MIPGGIKATMLAIAFFAITSLTIALTRFGGGLALVWFGTAILAAVLVTLPRSRWPRILWLFGALSALATSLFGFGLHMALQLALVNVFEGYLVARLLIAWRPQRDWLESVGGLVVLFIAGGLVGPALAAIPGGLLVSLSMPGDWPGHALDWLAAHGLGTLLAFPIAFLAASGALAASITRASSAAIVESVVHAALVGLVTALVFLQHDRPLLFLPIVPLLFAAFRRGRVGASLGLLTIASIAVVSLATGIGFSHAALDTFGDKVLFLQFYLAVLLLLALPVSIVLKQQELLYTQLDEKKALEGLIADHSDDALLNLDADGRIRLSSPAGIRLSGQAELTGRPLAVFFDPLDETLVRNTLAKAGADPGATCVIERAVSRGEEQVWLEARMRAVPSAGAGREIAGFAVTIRDVTASKQAELRALREADTDALTGLPNRRALLRHLEARLEHAAHRPFMFAIVDLDHFKCVNDTYGHDAGDRVLREVAAVMCRMSAPDRFFARLGGDEFALIAERVGIEEANALCEELRAAIAALELTGPDGAAIPTTASVGLARIDEPCSASRALQAADGPLYAAKSGDRDRVEIAPAGEEPGFPRRSFGGIWAA
ncbi:MAG: diguanylate cyclase, partial [Alphaproteobacteria bacterium]|nr:diguanylate cyclase [Alphaproteobacteria bacterium]